MARINRAIELLEQGQPLYYTSPGERSYEGGIEAVGTWADYLMYEMEHGVYDVPALQEFMRGLAAGGPTRSGHRTPTVIVTLPTDGTMRMWCVPMPG
jgi:4-hydroxy-2-oxoheptanedioate aldolase